MFYEKNITSNDTDDNIWGKVDDLKRNAKTRLYINKYFIKILGYLKFIMGRCCSVFRENRNSLNIQNCGRKFAKFAYFCKIS